MRGFSEGPEAKGPVKRAASAPHGRVTGGRYGCAEPGAPVGWVTYVFLASANASFTTSDLVTATRGTPLHWEASSPAAVLAARRSRYAVTGVAATPWTTTDIRTAKTTTAHISRSYGPKLPSPRA